MKKSKVSSIIIGMVLVAGLSLVSTNAQQMATPVSGGGGTTTVTPVPALPPPPVLPIQSITAIREYALASVVRGFRSVSANSMDGSFPGALTYVEATGKGAEAVLDKLFAVEFKYKLANPDEQIIGRVSLYDANGVQIFYGQADYSAQEIKAGNPPVYWIGINNIPLMQNVRSAEILAINEDRVTANTIRLNVNDRGQIMFDPWMAGAVNGILAVRLTDGQVVTYKLSNPVLQDAANSTETVSTWNIGGHHVFRGGVRLVSVMELYQDPTILLEVISLDPVAFDITGLVQNKGGVNTFERPIVIDYTQMDGQKWSGFRSSNQSGPTIITFPEVGTYRIKFEWKNFTQPNMLYTGPQDGGGKG